jgi:hypothetical protein
MVLDLSDGEAAALAQLLRRTINDDPYQLSPRLAPLKAILARLSPPRPTSEPPPALQGRDAPSAAQTTTPRMKAYRGPADDAGQRGCGVRLVVWRRDCDTTGPRIRDLPAVPARARPRSAPDRPLIAIFFL